MTPLEQLKAWLEQPVYEAGVVLYEQLFGPGFMLSMLQRRADDYNRDKLTQALAQKCAELEAAWQALIDSYPPSLDKSLEEGKTLMDERTMLKERCRMLYNSGITESAELKEYAFGIRGITDQLDAIYGRKDFFEQHGYLPDVVSIDAEQTPAQLKQRQLSLRTYLTRYNKKLAQPISDQQRTKYQTLLEGYGSELHQIDQQLAALNNSNHVLIHD